MEQHNELVTRWLMVPSKAPFRLPDVPYRASGSKASRIWPPLFCIAAGDKGEAGAEAEGGHCRGSLRAQAAGEHLLRASFLSLQTLYEAFDES